MSQAGILSISAAGGVTSVTGNDGITTSPSTGAVQIFAKATGTRNIWLGESAGNNSISGTAQNNTSLGYLTLNALTDGASNTGIGSNTLPVVTTGGTNTGLGAASLNKLTTGSSNTAVGKSALDNLVSGTTNVCVGIGAGSVYTTNESNNICIGGNTGVIGDGSVIRIGTIQSTCYVQGIASVATSNSQAVTIDTTSGQLGSTVSPAIQRPIVSVSGTTKTFALTDANTFQQCSNGSTQTLTVPTNASVAFATGTEIDVWQQGAGQVVFAAAGGVTIQSAFSNLKVATQYTGASLKYLGSDTWALVGNLTA